MFDFFRWQIYILSFMSVICAAVVVFESHNMAPEIIGRCKAGNTTMRAATLLFVVFFWCAAMGVPHDQCLQHYGELSKTCRIVGETRVVFSILSILLSFLYTVLKASEKAKDCVVSAARTALAVGCGYLIAASLLMDKVL